MYSSTFQMIQTLDKRENNKKKYYQYQNGGSRYLVHYNDCKSKSSTSTSNNHDSHYKEDYGDHLASTRCVNRLFSHPTVLAFLEALKQYFSFQSSLLLLLLLFFLCCCLEQRIRGCSRE